MPERPSLADRVALVTGVSRRIGIGFGLARRLLRDGARVYATGFAPHDAEMPWGADAEDPTEALREGLDDPSRLHWSPADLEDPDAPARLVDAVIDHFGTLDLLIANHARSSHDDLASVTANELDRCWAANVRSVLLLVQRMAERRPPDPPDRPRGRVLFLTSGQHVGPMPDEIGYAVTKGALHQITATLADAVADAGITVNCINPGPTDTGYAQGRGHARVAGMFPGGRWGTPEDVANLMAWLVGAEGAWITGQVLVSEGGFRRWVRDPTERS